MSPLHKLPRSIALRPLAATLSVSMLALLGACHHSDDNDGGTGGSTDSGSVVASTITVNHADGTTETLTPGAPSTPSNAGSVVAPNTSPVVPDKPIPVAAGTTLLLMGNRSGASQLGEIYQVYPGVNTTKVVKTFTGRPWSSSEAVAANGMVFNAADGRFYGVLDRVGLTHDAGVLFSFDPKTDTFKALKTLSGEGVGSTAGLNGTSVRDLPRGGFERKPLLSPDGKSMLLLASWGGRDDRGLLIHVNLDASSNAYLKETVVYDFFSYEESKGDTCQALEGTPTELVWGKDAGGKTVVFMGREGVAYTLNPSAPDPTHPKCNTLTDPSTSKVVENKFGQMFKLQPSDASDLSRPWVYAGSEAVLKSPLYVSLGRHIGFDSYRNKVRWTTENKADGELGLYSGGSTIGDPAYSASQSGTWDTGCFRLTGMVMTDVPGNGILLCGGLNGSDPSTSAAWVKDQPPMLFTQRGGNGNLSFLTEFNDWYASKLSIDGATWGEASRRLYLTGGAGGSAIDGRVQGYADVSRIEEINTASTPSSRRTLAKGSLNGSGFGFFSDPAVGGASNEPVNDRYVVWVGTVVAGASMTLNKYDRYTDQTTTIRFETDAGAHPWGKLLDLGNGLAMGRMENTPPKYGKSNTDKIGGYRGAIGYDNPGSQPGVFTMNVLTGQVVSMAAQDGGNFSPELARTDDGQVWGIRYSEWNNNGYLYEQLRKIDPATGRSVVVLDNNRGTSEKLPVRRHSPEARNNAVYGIWFNSFLTPAQAPSSTNETVFCQRSDVNLISYSGVIGPNDQSGLSTPRVPVSGDAHGTVEGPTYSPTHNALYLATRRVGATDAVTIFEIDKGVAKADLCKQAPVMTRIASSGASDVPATKILVTKAGMLVYGSVSGKLMKIDPTAGTITQLADLKATGAARSQIKGFLTEIADGTIGAIVHDFDASGRNLGRRLAGVSTTGSQVGSHDVSRLIGESDPYPGVNRFN